MNRWLVWRQLDDDSLARARIYVESREAPSRESGGTPEHEITLFKSVGVAVEDIAPPLMLYRTRFLGHS